VAHPRAGIAGFSISHTNELPGLAVGAGARSCLGHLARGAGLTVPYSHAPCACMFFQVAVRKRSKVCASMLIPGASKNLPAPQATHVE
jgi:hypothetical protein